MHVGLVGKRGAGKTVIFNAVTGLNVSLYGDKENIGGIKVPDERIDFLSNHFKPKKTTYAEVVLNDLLAGSGCANADSLPPQLVAKIREVDAVALAVDNFSDDAEPLLDIQSYIENFILFDLMVVEKRLEKVQKEGRGTSQEAKFLNKLKEYLDDSKLLKNCQLSDQELESVMGYKFLTLQPVIVIFNNSEDGIGFVPEGELKNYLETEGFEHVSLSGSIEMELNDLDPAEKEEFLSDLGLKEPAKNRLVQIVYHAMNYISFFTVGEDEVRAWTIEKGSDAVTAAAKIHTDIQRGFIRAEVIQYSDFLEFKDMQKIKENGKMQLEGKTYIVEDGNIVHYRFNV